MVKSRKNILVTSTLSMALIMFFLAFFLFLGILGYLAPKLAQQELTLKIMLKPDVDDERALKLKRILERKPYVLSVKYISKEEALQKFDIGSEFLQAMDSINPLLPALDIKLKTEYVSPEFIRKIGNKLVEYEEVKEVNYPLNLILKLEQRKKLYLSIAIIIGVLLLIVTYILIYNTIKLSIISKRFLIRTMELLGATRSFIAKPFIQSAVVQAFLAALIADLFLYLLALGITRRMPSFKIFLELNEVKLLFLLLPLVGIVMGWLASRSAINKFLGKSLEEIA